MRKLSRRIGKLESQRFDTTGAMLTMPDGRSEILRGPGDYMRELLAGACRGERTPTLQLLARSVGSTEPGGGHLLELARAILNSPRDDAEVI